MMGLFGNSSLMPGEDDRWNAWQHRTMGFPAPANPSKIEQVYGMPGMNNPMQPAPPQQDGAPQQAPESWMNGGKFRTRDALGLALGAIGDAFAQHNGGQAVALPMLMQGMQAARQEKKSAAAQAGAIRDLMAQGMTEAQARSVISGTASYGDVHPKAPEEDVFIRQMRAAGIDPASPQGQAVLRQRVAVQASPQPQLIGDGMGGGKWVQPPAPSIPGMGASAQAGLPHGYDPNEWEPIAGPPPQQGAPTPPQAPGSFTPDAANMQRLYQQQFGPQKGQAMFQEWLRNSRHGGR